MKSILRRYSLVIYFCLAYIIAWGGSIFLASTKSFQAAALTTGELGLMFVFMLLGPSLSGLFLTTFLEGRDGLKKLFSGMGQWRIGFGWAAVVFLTVPMITSLVLVVLSNLVSPVFQIKLSLTQVGFGLAAGLLAGFFEETGWTGFALPHLQSKYGVPASGLILGILWGAWHMMADYWGNINTLNTFWFPNFILFWLMPLTAYRVLMVWMYKNTHSLLAAQIMHAFYSGTLIALSPTTPIAEGMLWKALFAVALWGALAFVVIKFGNNFSNKNSRNENLLGNLIPGSSL